MTGGVKLLVFFYLRVACTCKEKMESQLEDTAAWGGRMLLGDEEKKNMMMMIED